MYIYIYMYIIRIIINDNIDYFLKKEYQLFSSEANISYGWRRRSYTKRRLNLSGTAQCLTRVAIKPAFIHTNQDQTYSIIIVIIVIIIIKAY